MKTRTTLASHVIVMALLPLIVNTGNCQVVFEDDFGNGNADTPVKWTPRLLPFGEYDATSGDYIFRALAGFDTSGAALASDPADFVLEDTSAVSQVRADGPFDNMGIGARWTESVPSGYFNGITGSGLVIIGRTDGPDDFTILASADTDLDVGSQDVLLRLDAIGTTLKTWAWLPGDTMPDEPLLSVEDTLYQSGTPAIYANPRPDGQAIFRFVNVSVPEPAALPLATFGFLSLLGYRKESIDQ